MNTQMANAFRNAQVSNSVIGSKLVDHVISAITNADKRKPSADEQRGWSAKLSFRTYNQLKADGVMA